MPSLGCTWGRAMWFGTGARAWRLLTSTFSRRWRISVFFLIQHLDLSIALRRHPPLPSLFYHAGRAAIVAAVARLALVHHLGSCVRQRLRTEEARRPHAVQAVGRSGRTTCGISTSGKRHTVPVQCRSVREPFGTGPTTCGQLATSRDSVSIAVPVDARAPVNAAPVIDRAKSATPRCTSLFNGGRPVRLV